MRKHNEGYALVLVLVIMIVLCLLSSAIMSGSLRNLKAQMSSLEQMEAKYRAQGEIEAVIGTLEAAAASDALYIPCQDVYTENCSVVYNAEENNNHVIITATCDNVQIQCILKISCFNMHITGTGTYTIEDFKGITCTSYLISANGGDGQ